MATFRVWAPKAQKMEVQLRDRLLVMQCSDDGWWSAEEPECGPGTDYGFVIDGSGPFPDPRSRWQPEGVHGLSRLVELSTFQWSDAGFQSPPLSSAVIYELHTGTFTPEGTFDSAILKLDYLRDLGVTHVELMPVNTFSGNHGWGYDGTDLYAAEFSYGGPEGLMRLVDACHARGLGVILDVVYNHIGPEGNYLDQFAPYHSQRHNTAWGPAMNFDGPGSDEVRRFFLDNALSWLRDFHIDGLRLDAIHAIIDTSAVHFLEELAAVVENLEACTGRHHFLIAESDLNDPRVVRSREAGGYGIDAQWSDDFHHALHVLLTGEQNGYYAAYSGWEDLPEIFRNVFAYRGAYSPTREHHHGRPVGDLPGTRFLAYLQNHDQVGNRAQGDRITFSTGPELAKIGAALVLLSPFVPMLFQGEEWGASTPFQYFSSHQDPGLGRAVSEGRRKEFSAFGWDPEQVPDPQEPETFYRSKLNWEERQREPHAGLLDWYRRLIALRRSHPDLCGGHLDRVRCTASREGGWLRLERGRVRVVCNLRMSEQRLPLERQQVDVLLHSHAAARLEDGQAVLPPQSVIVYEVQEKGT